MEHPNRLTLTSREFADWKAFNRIETFGDERDDLRMGILASTVAAGFMKKPPAPCKFMPYYKTKPMTPDQINAVLMRAKQGARRGGKHRKP